MRVNYNANVFYVVGRSLPPSAVHMFLLSTTGVRAQRGLQYLVCVSVCLFVYDYSRTTCTSNHAEGLHFSAFHYIIIVLK